MTDPSLDLCAEAIAITIRRRQISTTSLQRALYATGRTVGYGLCALLLARMEIEGIVGRVDAERRRDVLRRLI